MGKIEESLGVAARGGVGSIVKKIFQEIAKGGGIGERSRGKDNVSFLALNEVCQTGGGGDKES